MTWFGRLGAVGVRRGIGILGPALACEIEGLGYGAIRLGGRQSGFRSATGGASAGRDPHHHDQQGREHLEVVDAAQPLGITGRVPSIPARGDNDPSASHRWRGGTQAEPVRPDDPGGPISECR